MSVAMFIYVILLLGFELSFTVSVPPEACFAPFRWDDCGGLPTPVVYYWKPGSRCEVGTWRGCLPNPNMFGDEYECVQTCIFAMRAQPPDFHDVENELLSNEMASQPTKSTSRGTTDVHTTTNATKNTTNDANDTQSTNAFFRKDYTFMESTHSFYKFHTIHRTWREARTRCELEGTTLFYPDDQAEGDAVVSWWNQTQPFHYIYIGISDLASKRVFETVDGKPISDVFNKWASGEPNDADGAEDCIVVRRHGDLSYNDTRCDKRFPYICKKSQASIEWNAFCDMPDRHYLYDGDLGKCYKFHLTPLSWTEAYSVCNAEQSYLAVINSQKEADHLVKLTAEAPKDNVKGDYRRGFVHLGFHRKDEDGWKTVRGTSLEQSGYAKWGNQQPNGGDKETCGTMDYNGHLNDMACDRKCFFICEHDIGLLNSTIDERFGTVNKV